MYWARNRSGVRAFTYVRWLGPMIVLKFSPLTNAEQNEL